MMRILIAVDERISPESISIVLRNHVWSFPCEIKVVHAIKATEGSRFVGLLKESLRLDIAEERRCSGEQLVRRVAIALRDALHTTHVEEEVLEGDPREAIIKCAQDWEANLVVVFSQVSPSAARQLGSVS